MSERVFVSAASVKCPGATRVDDLADLASGDRSPVLDRVDLPGHEVQLGEAIDLDRESPFYPKRSNEKVMRTEVIAAMMAVCELLEAADVPAGAKSEMPLFVASGATLEREARDSDWFARAMRASTECCSSRERNQRLVQLTPPLLALRTLTNASSSFIAEHTSIAGNNSTFGNTSTSGFYALEAGFDAVRSGSCTMALVGGASRGGMASYLMYRNFFPDPSGWRESLATAFLLLEGEASVRDRRVRPICEVTLLESARTPPVLAGADRATPFARLAERLDPAPRAVFSGAFCRSEHERFRGAVSASWVRTHSLFDSIGNGGTANVFLSVLTACSLADPAEQVDCLDRDPYSRECLVRIARAEDGAA